MSEHEEYTPPMGQIRSAYADTAYSDARQDALLAVFDRAIAAHDRELREEAAAKVEASENELATLLDMFAENETWETTGAEMARRIISSVGRSIRGEEQDDE